MQKMSSMFERRLFESFRIVWREGIPSSFFLRHSALMVGLAVPAMNAACDSGPVHDPSDYTIVHPASDTVVTPEWKPIDGDKPTMAKLGQEAMATLGYDEIIQRAEKAGWIRTVPIARIPSTAGKVLMADAATVAADQVVKLFTRYAFTAGVTSQVDSPVPGPADVVAVGILAVGLIHAGYVLAEEIVAAQQVQATASSIPTATATTTTTAPPIALPRRHPKQTCDDKRLDELEAAKKSACQAFPGKSCSQRTEKEKARARVYPCSVILARIAAMNLCVVARQRVQDECFKNATDAGHHQQIADLTQGITSCEVLKLMNCAPGHPMSGL